MKAYQAIAAGAAALALTFAGCSAPSTPSPSAGGSSARAVAARPLRVWAGSTTPITIDFNPFHVDTTLFGTYGPIYEPLFFFNQLSADPPTPMIGESYAYSTDASLREAAADPERLGRLRDEVRAEHAGRPR